MPPSRNAGASTLTFWAPKMSRASCWSMRLTPQVTSSVSSGRPYSRRMSRSSRIRPIVPATRNATGSARPNDERDQPGPERRLQHVGRVRAGHDELAVRHVDHVHLAERERQPERDEQQDRRDARARRRAALTNDVHRCRTRLLAALALEALGPGVGLQERVRLDRLAGAADLVDQPVGLELADARGLVDVLVLAVDRDLALGRLERRGPWTAALTFSTFDASRPS